MKNISYIKGNRIIAEFMEIKLNGGGLSVFEEQHFDKFRVTEYERDGICEYCHNSVAHGHNCGCYVIDDSKIEYHKSFDAIIPVVQKIESMGKSFPLSTRLDIVWLSVIRCIERLKLQSR